MGGPDPVLMNHLASGLTTVCRCWSILRTDGTEFGFTDHDCDLAFDGVKYRANTGLSALAVQQSTGLSVDNTEAIGALSDAAIRQEDIEAGRFDGATVTAWLVNWAEISMRWRQFRGTIGELRRVSGAFQAELRGLTEGLNRPVGRVYQKPCTAVLGDGSCRFDLNTVGYFDERALGTVVDGRVFHWPDLPGFEPGWFTRGRLRVLTGAAAGLWGAIKRDVSDSKGRHIELWEPIRDMIEAGDMIRLEAGCDKRMDTCRLKFSNLINFQGFPDIPGEDWMMSVPKRSDVNSGASRR